MLSFSTHDHFARKLNPEREGRLLGVSTGGGSGSQNVEGRPEGERRGAEGSHAGGADVSAIAANVNVGINARILAPERIDAMLRQPSGLIALLEHDHGDLRRQVEERMRRENEEYYRDQLNQPDLPLHEIVWYLRDHEDAAGALRAAAVERLRSPEAFLHFTNTLDKQLQKLQDIEEALNDTHPGLRLGSIDIGRLRGTEQWLRDQCRERGLTIADPTLSDWLSGRYTDFQPDKAKIQSVMQFLTGRENALPEEASFDTSGVPEGDRLRARLNQRIREEYTGTDDDPNAVLNQEGKLSRTHWVRSFDAAKQWLRRRKLLHLFLSSTPAANEDELAARTLDEQISILQKQLIEMRTVVREDLRERAQLVRERMLHQCEEQFDGVDSSSALQRFGASQALLGGRAVVAALEPLESIIFSPPSPESPGFERFAEDSYSLLEEIAGEDLLGQAIESARLDHRDTVAWATHLWKSGKIERTLQALKSRESRFVQQMPAEAVEQLETLLKRLERVATGTATGDDFDLLEQEVAGRQGKQRINMLCYTLSNTSFRQRAEQADKQFESMQMENTEDERERVQREYGEVKARFADLPVLRHTVCRVLHIEDGLLEQYTTVRINLQAAKKGEGTAEGTESLKSAQDTVQHLTEAEELLRGVSENIVRADTPGQFVELGSDSPDEIAIYNRDTGQLVLNMQQITARNLNVDHVIEHEKGHIIVDILTRRTGLFEGILIRTSELLDGTTPANQLPGQEHTFRELLGKQARKWHVEQKWQMILERARRETGGNEEQAQALAQERYQERLMDELLNQYAFWVERGRPTDSTDPEQIALYQHIEEIMEPEELRQIDTGVLREAQIGESDVMYLSRESIGDGGTTGAPHGGGDESAEAGMLDINTGLIDLRRGIEKVRVFADSFPEYGNTIRPIYDNFDQTHRMVQQEFQAGRATPGGVSQAIKYIKNKLDPLLKELENIRGEKVSISKAGAGGKKDWRAIFHDFNFVSIMDVVRMFKQGWEDLNRYWTRRGDSKQASLGYAITKLIPKDTPYVGRLQDEFLRRDRDSETKEVNEWKEKFDDFSSYYLLRMLGQVRNKDQAKAIFMLLTDRGRMEWSNEKMWDTLNALSNFSMPIHACRNDDVLRDKWLRKLISDIWGGQDLYTTWRQANDGAVKSGKEKFTAMVDQLSNIQGGLERELINQLVLWEDKRTGRGASTDLNPHLYEEILDYSMRNGKMTMEGKLFYLVRGVAVGLLSIDRLRTMAGETSGILSRYPWLDYFYKKNNTLPEVEALNERLEEPGKPFDYGPKTTLWLHLEVMRVESTRERISKAISGVRAENLDHEDVPTLVSQADWTNIDRMTGMVSGTREKLSPEAVRNSYTGFGTKFKALARLVQMEEDNVAQFTDRDMHEAAKAIVAYIHMDNIFTRNASKGDRPVLTWDHIDNGTGPSTSNLTVAKYRTPQNDFVFNVVQESGFDFSRYTHINAGNLIRRENMEHLEESDRTRYIPTQQESRYEEARDIMGQLQETIMQRPDVVKKCLKKFADHFREENYADKAEGWLTEDNTREYFASRFRSTA